MGEPWRSGRGGPREPRQAGALRPTANNISSPENLVPTARPCPQHRNTLRSTVSLQARVTTRLHVGVYLCKGPGMYLGVPG